MVAAAIATRRSGIRSFIATFTLTLLRACGRSGASMTFSKRAPPSNSDGKPKTGVNRALPDGEIRVGTPIPAIVPLPTLGMAPMPAKVELTDLSPLKPGEGQGAESKCCRNKMARVKIW